MKANPKGAAYFNRKITLYYYPEQAASIRLPNGSLTSLVSLRDKAADVNLMPAEVARSLNLSWKPTHTRLSTSLDTGHSVPGELDGAELSFVLLPGTPHAKVIRLTATLVVDMPGGFFQLLVGNEQAHLVADGMDS
ncbi:hypothetical protein GPECTOR_410g251 [Gonium pectorale]|uniref:Uncharacterized protein n=1 Tax=Gonium pectorale TaxID=33097 RepID=A0A150FV86_GONPE|nr:hypothetical protein GPECTOR_410g251 [Gonium pectorale]|eukprot:KXZ41533.1 hypothetical protein GPECTOR_410g251 [Gonium pectorale]